MSCRRQFVATCFAIAAFTSMAGTAAAETSLEKAASSAAIPAPDRGQEVVEIIDLQPFTHMAYIAVSAQLSSIKVEGVKVVKMATRLRSVTNPHYCEERLMTEPAATLDCPRITAEWSVPAYQVTYSLTANPRRRMSTAAPISPLACTSTLTN